MSSIPDSLRQQVSDQDKGRCAYCQTQTKIVGTNMTIDHIVPRFHNGQTTTNNLCLACSDCNLYKGVQVVAQDPETGEWVALFHPRQQNWSDHFAWATAKTHVIGLTPTGRATVAALRLNRWQLVRARAIWAKFNLHPPDN